MLFYPFCLQRAETGPWAKIGEGGRMVSVQSNGFPIDAGGRISETASGDDTE